MLNNPVPAPSSSMRELGSEGRAGDSPNASGSKHMRSARRMELPQLCSPTEVWSLLRRGASFSSTCTELQPSARPVGKENVRVSASSSSSPAKVASIDAAASTRAARTSASSSEVSE